VNCENGCTVLAKKNGKLVMVPVPAAWVVKAGTGTQHLCTKCLNHLKNNVTDLIIARLT